MAGPTDILTAIQNGVVALNNFGQQVKGSFLNIASQLTANATNTSANTAALAAMQAAWAVYTPTITASAGVFTTVSATGTFLIIGKLVHLTFTITITTVGTASGQLQTTLPAGLPREAAVLAVGDLSNGSGGFCFLQGSTSTSIILKYDGTTLIRASGSPLIITGIYEQQ